MQDKLGAHTVHHKLLTLYQQNLSRYTWEMKHFSGIFQTIYMMIKSLGKFITYGRVHLRNYLSLSQKVIISCTMKERTFKIIINNTSLREKKGKKKRSVHCWTSKNMKIKCEI